MKYPMSLLVIISILTQGVSIQFKNDNLAYKTVFIDDLCDSLRNNPGRLILDVRSRGEFSDTSASSSLNIGHLKGAIYINVNEVKTRLNELLPYKHKPIFVYYSHSQRRVTSKILSDSGFTNVININGAMTEFNLVKNTSIPCANELYETTNLFKLLSPLEVAGLISSHKKVLSSMCEPTPHLGTLLQMSQPMHWGN